MGRLGAFATGAFFLGSTLLFVGERVLDDRARWMASGLGLALLALGWLAHIGSAIASGAGRRGAALGLTLAHLGGLAAIGLYFLSTDAGMAWLGFELPFTDAAKRLRVVLQVGFPILWLASALPLALMQRALGSSGTTRPPDDLRVAEAGFGGMSVAFAAAALFTVNYLATEHDQTMDLSYFRTARPGPATRGLVQRLAQPVDVILFFPEANDVAEEIAGYFRDLARENELLTVSIRDRLIDHELAKQHKIRTDGVVLIQQGEIGKQWNVGTQLENSRHNLRKLDREVYSRLLEVARSERVAYLTIGHGELNDQSFGAGPKATWVRTLLRRLNYEVKNLGLSEGLAAQVPGDASVLMIVGPEEPFLPEEIESLIRYVETGGRLFLALDPGQQENVGRLLDYLGLEYPEGVLTIDKERHFVPRRFNVSDRQNLVTASFSSHPSVQGLSSGGRRATLVVVGAGSLLRAATHPGGKVDFPVRSMTGTWADLDADFEFSADVEERKVHYLAAAIERPVAGEAGRADNSEDETQMRAFVLADSGLLDDALLRRVLGNAVLVGDAVEWLTGGDGATTALESEEDIPVQHSRAEDRLWFYATVFGAPLLVALFGFLLLRTRQRARR